MFPADSSLDIQIWTQWSSSLSLLSYFWGSEPRSFLNESILHFFYLWLSPIFNKDNTTFSQLPISEWKLFHPPSSQSPFFVPQLEYALYYACILFHCHDLLIFIRKVILRVGLSFPQYQVCFTGPQYNILYIVVFGCSQSVFFRDHLGKESSASGYPLICNWVSDFWYKGDYIKLKGVEIGMKFSGNPCAHIWLTFP